MASSTSGARPSASASFSTASIAPAPVRILACRRIRQFRYLSAPRPSLTFCESTCSGRKSPPIIARQVARQERGWVSWMTTTDHKRIGILYMVTAMVFFVLGGIEALLMRLQLGLANNNLVTPQTYNQLFTMHGTTMVFLFVVPMMAGFGNYLLPLMIGARDMAFPRLNALSYWLLLAGGVVFYSSLFFRPPHA